VIALGGVSKVYGEDDLGGFHIIGKVAVAFSLGQQKPVPKPKPAKRKP
jgi:hypothetical protein